MGTLPRSGGEHCHRELPGGGEEGGGGGEVADIKSNNPHLTGGEQTYLHPSWFCLIKKNKKPNTLRFN